MEKESGHGAGRRGRTITARTRRDEIWSKAQLEPELRQGGQERGLTRTPGAWGSSEERG